MAPPSIMPVAESVAVGTRKTGLVGVFRGSLGHSLLHGTRVVDSNSSGGRGGDDE